MRWNIVIIYTVCAFIVFYVFCHERDTLLNANHEAAYEIHQHYQYQYDNFYSVYTPVFLNYKEGKDIFKLYAAAEKARISMALHSEMLTMARMMSTTNSDLIGLVMYHSKFPNNAYLYITRPRSLTLVNIDMEPFDKVLPLLKQRTSKRALLGAQLYNSLLSLASYSSINSSKLLAYGIAGSLPRVDSSEGSLMALYSVSQLQTIWHSHEFTVEPHIIIASDSGQIMFDSNGTLYGDICYISTSDNNE